MTSEKFITLSKVIFIIILCVYFSLTDEKNNKEGWRPLEKWPNELISGPDYNDGIWVNIENASEEVFFLYDRSSKEKGYIHFIVREELYDNLKPEGYDGRYFHGKFYDTHFKDEHTYLYNTKFKIEDDDSILIFGKDGRSGNWPNPFNKSIFYAFIKWDPYEDTITITRKYRRHHPLDSKLYEYINLEPPRTYYYKQNPLLQ